MLALRAMAAWFVGLGSPLGPVGNAISGAVSDAAAGAARATAAAVFDALTSWVARGTADLVGSLIAVIDHQTEPKLGSSWFTPHYQAMAGVAMLLVLPLLLAAAVTAIVRRDPGALIRATFVQLPLAALGTGMAVTLIDLALAGTDELCAMVSASTGNDAATVLSHLAAGIVASVAATSGFAGLLVCLIVAFAAFLVTVELVVRSAAVYVAVLFLPVALAGMVWPTTARWGRRLAELLAVLILSKFVIVAILSMAVGALAAGMSGGGLGGLLTGAALLLLAASGPFALLRMVPIVEAGAIAHLDGAGRRIATPPAVVENAARGHIEGVLRGAGAGGGADLATGPAASGVDLVDGVVPDAGTAAAGVVAAGAAPVAAVAAAAEAGGTVVAAHARDALSPLDGGSHD